MGLPPTQVENERVFCLAGRIAAPLRKRISTNLISNLVAIACNHPGFDDVEEGSTIAVTSMEEFSDYLLDQEKVEESEDGSMCHDPPIITHLSLHLVIYCLGCIAIADHDFMAAMERGNTQYRYYMHLYIKGDINCFAERMYSMRILRDSTCQTRDKTQARCMNFASRCKGYIS